jgi:hypothetical protein
MKTFDLLNMGMGEDGRPKTLQAAMSKQYQFWDTQPVPKICELSNAFFLFLFFDLKF